MYLLQRIVYLFLGLFATLMVSLLVVMYGLVGMTVAVILLYGVVLVLLTSHLERRIRQVTDTWKEKVMLLKLFS